MSKVVHLNANVGFKVASRHDSERDIDALLESFKLHNIRRFYDQIYWHGETIKASLADKMEPGLKLENVSAHSWHVADSAILLAGHFPKLDYSKVVTMAVLHDKLEIYTGDFDPVGSDGKGTDSHAFCSYRRKEKDLLEKQALASYLKKLRSSVREEQANIFEELLAGCSPESCFVKAIDKLQALAFVYLKKSGELSNDHLKFTLRYSKKSIVYFPGIGTHYYVLASRLLKSVAQERGVQLEEIVSLLSEQTYDSLGERIAL